MAFLRALTPRALPFLLSHSHPRLDPCSCSSAVEKSPFLSGVIFLQRTEPSDAQSFLCLLVRPATRWVILPAFYSPAIRRRIAKSGMTVSVHCTDRQRGSGWGSTVGPRTDASKPTFPRNRPISIALGFLPLLKSGVRFRKSDCDRLASCAVYTGPTGRDVVGSAL